MRDAVGTHFETAGGDVAQVLLRHQSAARGRIPQVAASEQPGYREDRCGEVVALQNRHGEPQDIAVGVVEGQPYEPASLTGLDGVLQCAKGDTSQPTSI